MNAERIAELRALAEKATPGPWQRNDVPALSLNVVDAAFIASARTALPEALDEIDRLNGEFRDEAIAHGLRLREVNVLTVERDEAVAEGDRLRGILATIKTDVLALKADHDELTARLGQPIEPTEIAALTDGLKADLELYGLMIVPIRSDA